MVRRQDDDLAAAARLLNISIEQLRETPIGAILIQRDSRFALQFVKLLQRLIRNTGSVEYTKAWLDAPHDDLEGRSPLSVIRAGHISVIEDLIAAYETGQPS